MYASFIQSQMSLHFLCFSKQFISPFFPLLKLDLIKLASIPKYKNILRDKYYSDAYYGIRHAKPLALDVFIWTFLIVSTILHVLSDLYVVFDADTVPFPLDLISSSVATLLAVLMYVHECQRKGSEADNENFQKPDAQLQNISLIDGISCWRFNCAFLALLSHSVRLSIYITLDTILTPRPVRRCLKDKDQKFEKAVFTYKPSSLFAIIPKTIVFMTAEPICLFLEIIPRLLYSSDSSETQQDVESDSLQINEQVVPIFSEKLSSSNTLPIEEHINEP